MDKNLIQKIGLNLSVFGVSALMFSCAGSSHKQSSELYFRKQSDYDFLTYMEPQDSFEFVRSRLNRSVSEGTLRLSREDVWAIRDFCSGVEADGCDPKLQKGRCNQITALMQAVLCRLQNPETKASYLNEQNITGFYDREFEKALVDFLKDQNNHSAAKQIVKSGIITPEIVEQLYFEAVSQGRVK